MFTIEQCNACVALLDNYIDFYKKVGETREDFPVDLLISIFETTKTDFERCANRQLEKMEDES